ncbi:DNA-binding response regulator [Clostridia bacterium]|nr:DNA-binding response regulator [Clostridia bacterium]
MISLYLTKEGYKTLEAKDGAEAFELFKNHSPHLVLLDIMLPVEDGYQVCKKIRRISQTPIIMITARGETIDKVQGLSIGADDYIVKPFDAKEMVARVKAVLRRYDKKDENTATGKQVAYADLYVDLDAYTVIYRGTRVDFTPKELELLYFLASNPDRAFTRDQLLDYIWGFEFAGDTRTVDVHIKRVREKLPEPTNWAIATVWGVGYKFETK